MVAARPAREVGARKEVETWTRANNHLVVYAAAGIGLPLYFEVSEVGESVDLGVACAAEVAR